MLNTRVWCENKLFEEFWTNIPELNEKKLKKIMDIISNFEHE